MRNEVVRLRRRAGPQDAGPWHARAMSNRPPADRGASVVMLFPERSVIAQVQPDAVKLFRCLELENAELRCQVVELALQIQELKERRR
jgi:hypothetical protein